MVSNPNYQVASALIARAKAAALTVATAESCTGGLIAASLAAAPGASAVLERGFVTYSNDAKAEMLGVPSELIRECGAVSREVALAMAEGALAHSRADLVVAVTGIAGPTGGSAEKPVGLVHIAAARRGAETRHEEMRYGELERHEIQSRTVADALRMLSSLIA